ncbi:MAG: hypothetical protein JXR05_00425 [Flavobacteriaceae bacterium]
MEIDFKSTIDILDIYSWMDGGSVTLKCKDRKRQKFDVEFKQNVFWEVYPSSQIPGRIYLNEILIEQRSELENQLLKSLTKSVFSIIDDIGKRLLIEKIEYVKSEKYLTDKVNIIFKEKRPT